MSDLYRRNPFCLLGLRATADARQVRRRIEDLDVEMRLGSTSSGLDGDGLRRIRQVLESPADRLKAELFWLNSEADGRTPDLSDSAGLNAEIERLHKLAGSSQGLRRVLATHDLAVLRHAVWLEAHAGPASIDAGHSYLRLALAEWQESLFSPDLVRYFESRRESAGAPTFDIQQVASEEILESVAVVASSAIDRRTLDEAAVLIDLMGSSGLPRAAIDHAAGEATKSLRGEITRGLSALATAGDDEGVPAVVVRAECELLVNSALGPFGRYERADPAADDALRDRVAVVTRLVSVHVYNKLQDAELAAAILDFALGIARSTSTVSHIAADRAQVRYLHHSAAAVAAFDSGSWAAAAAHAEIAEEYASSAENQAQMSSLANAARPRALSGGVNSAKAAIVDGFDLAKQRFAADVGRAIRFERVSYVPPAVAPPQQPFIVTPQASSARGKWIAAGVAALLLLLFGIANANSTGSRSTSSPATSAPARATNAPQMAPPRITIAPTTACRDQVRAMDSQLSGMDSDLTALQGRLKSVSGQIDSLRAEVRSTEAQYPRGIPSSIYPSYSASIDRINALVDDYNRRLATYKSNLADYNALVDRRNALNRSC